MLNRSLYIRALNFFDFSPTIDCFASRTNCQHPVYASLRPDPYATYVDAFSLNWQDFNCYIFPPFSVIGKVLQKIRINNVVALCVLPHWPTQAWWPLMQQMMVKGPLVLPPRQTNLVLPNSPKELHPLHQKLKLLICLLSGNIMRQ